MKATKTAPARRSAPAEMPLNDVYQNVTNRIIEALEGGVIPWRQGWNPEVGMPRNYATGHVYQGINAFLLLTCGVGTYPLFMTYKQATEAGGQVRKGEKGQKVIVAGYQEEREAAAGRDAKEGYSFFREFTVFNICQIDGIEWKIPQVMARTFTPDEAAETLANGYLDRPGAPSLSHGGGRAYYAPFADAIRMPPKNTFISSQEYYSVLFHELGHSTGAANRLNRPEVVDGSLFGGHAYGREELVAEMCTAFLGAELGYAPAPAGDQHAAYIQSWLKVIRGDKKLVIAAAAAAQKAAYLIRGVKAPEYEPRPAKAA